MVVFYDLEHRAYESSVVAPVAPVVEDDPIVCHCLQIRESAIQQAVSEAGARSLCEIACHTGAGSGCTACHRRLRQFFAQRKAASEMPPRFDVEAALDAERAVSDCLHPHPSATADSWPSQPR